MLVRNIIKELHLDKIEKNRKFKPYIEEQKKINKELRKKSIINPPVLSVPAGTE